MDTDKKIKGDGGAVGGGGSLLHSTPLHCLVPSCPFYTSIQGSRLSDKVPASQPQQKKSFREVK